MPIRKMKHTLSGLSFIPRYFTLLRMDIYLVQDWWVFRPIPFALTIQMDHRLLRSQVFKKFPAYMEP